MNGMASRHRSLVATFVIASFCGSTLLFLIQPIVGRLLLPLAGGAPALWNTSMLFYQTILLLGYLFAHLAIRWIPTLWHGVLQVSLLALPVVVLPLAIPVGLEVGVTTPIRDVLVLLATMIGLPFFALSTSSPTLQAWFARTDHPSASNPYFLYSAGNVGSMLALLSYPLLFEFFFNLSTQSKLWSISYGVFVFASLLCALQVAKRKATVPLKATTSIAWKDRASWVAWAFVPSAMMISVTGHITTNIASFPLLWILPLVFYLASFIVSFGTQDKKLASRVQLINKITGYALIAVTVTMGGTMWVPIVLSLLAFTSVAFFGHFRLALAKPEAAHVTEFFAWVSLGGVIGGIFSSLLAPMVFNNLIDFPILVVLSGSLLYTRPNHKWWVALVIVALCVAAFAITGQTSSRALACMAVVLLHFIRKPLLFVICIAASMFTVLSTLENENVLLRARSFFGSYKVTQNESANSLMVGTTFHGIQERDTKGFKYEPGTYYHPNGPVSDVFSMIQKRFDQGAHLGIIGLGIGQMIPYGRTNDEMTYFELDPLVVDIASNPAYFSYLKDAQSKVVIKTGDGRVEMERQTTRFDTIVIDAFSSDAIPIHLLTFEAIELYLNKLTQDGVLVFHISNHFFELEPVLGKIAKELNLHAKSRYDQRSAKTGSTRQPSHWLIISPNPENLDFLPQSWVPSNAGKVLWSDEHANALSTLRF